MKETVIFWQQLNAIGLVGDHLGLIGAGDRHVLRRAD
jgi:hypothetical protein